MYLWKIFAAFDQLRCCNCKIACLFVEQKARARHNSWPPDRINLTKNGWCFFDGERNEQEETFTVCTSDQQAIMISTFFVWRCISRQLQTFKDFKNSSTKKRCLKNLRKAKSWPKFSQLNQENLTSDTKVYQHDVNFLRFEWFSTIQCANHQCFKKFIKKLTLKLPHMFRKRRNKITKKKSKPGAVRRK